MVDVTTTGTLERWRSQTKARHVIKRVSLNGFTDELITGGSEFYVSPEERVLNQSRCKPQYDPFTNGAFEPVVLVDSVDDLHKFEPTPNTVTQSEIDELLGTMHWKTAEKRLAEIDSPTTLTRLLEAALESDTGSKRVEQIRDRLAAVAPTQVQRAGGGAVSSVQAFDPPDAPQEVSIYPAPPQDV